MTYPGYEGPEEFDARPPDAAACADSYDLCKDFEDLPEWLRPLAESVAAVQPGDQYLGRPHLRRSPKLTGLPRRSAVLILFGETPEQGPDVLITERSATLRSHAGQAAFPGGRIDELDGPVDGEGAIHAALRESREEAGVDPAGVRVFGRLPDLYIMPSDFLVTPVFAWWQTPGEVRVASPDEVASVHRVPVATLTDPANRYRVRHPSGHQGPAFIAGDLLVWGFTAGVLDGVIKLAGWERPWEPAELLEFPVDVREVRRTHGSA